MSFYGTAADFTTYHEERGRTIPATWTQTVIEAALLVASEWIDNAYVNLFVGYPTDGYSQIRQWPREAAYTNTYIQHIFANTDIPKEVKYATYEAAFREATENGSLNVDFTPGAYKSVSVDGAISVAYNTATQSSDVQVQIAIIGSLLYPLIDPDKSGMESTLSGSLIRG